ncbi:MAG TPA: DUF192 domain-containing protein [Gaiellaceae bacterium]
MRSAELRDGDRVVCERCLVAATPLARMRGLLGRRSLASGEGLLLRPASSVHTFFMRFPIDLVFLSAGGEVLKVVGSLPPWRLAAARSAKAVVELPAGEAGRRGIRVGDSLVLSREGSPDSGPAAGSEAVST